jgi:hypothetical protein
VGRAGRIRGGDRLPWVEGGPAGDSADNFAPLSSLDWQVHVYGDSSPAIRAACAERKLALHVFPWSPNAKRAGFRRSAAYLVRPDGYVALADTGRGDPSIPAYLVAHGIVSSDSG